MRYQMLGPTLLLTAFALPALAQTHISGTLRCGKPETSQAVEVGDHPGHLLLIQKLSCTWVSPIEIAGQKSTAYNEAAMFDMTGPKVQVRTYGWVTMSNGDKVYVRGQGTGNTKDGTLTAEGTWSITGGTGGLKGIQGKGTNKGSGPADAGVDTQIEGDYSLPQGRTPSSKK